MSLSEHGIVVYTLDCGKLLCLSLQSLSCVNLIDQEMSLCYTQDSNKGTGKKLSNGVVQLFGNMVLQLQPFFTPTQNGLHAAIC